MFFLCYEEIKIFSRTMDDGGRAVLARLFSHFFRLQVNLFLLQLNKSKGALENPRKTLDFSKEKLRKTLLYVIIRYKPCKRMFKWRTTNGNFHSSNSFFNDYNI